MAAISLVIPSHSDPRQIPRLMRPMSQDMSNLLEMIRRNPDSLREGLTMAAGALQGGKAPQLAIPVLIARLTLYPDTDFS